MKLRDYQIEAVDDLFTGMANPDHKGNLVALPTGTGKSLCIAASTKRVMMEKPGARIVMATHSQQLVKQNMSTLRAFMPGLRAGVYCAGLRHKELGNPVTFGSVQSMVNIVSKLGHIDVLNVDEAHLIPPGGFGQYMTFIKKLRKVNPDLVVNGWTATPYRLGLGSLMNTKMFDNMAHDATTRLHFERFIAGGYLCPLVAKATTVRQNVENVETRGGEYIQSQLATAVDDKGNTLLALQEACDMAAVSRKKWLVFCASIDHCEHVCEILNAMGTPAAALHSRVDNRDQVLSEYMNGSTQALVSCDMITTGFDYPRADCIVMLRPTLSTGLWVQMLGRGTRPHPEKENTLVLDFAGNTEKLGPIDDPVLPKKKGSGGGGSAPIKQCPDCRTYNHASVRLCHVCGYKFPMRSLVVFDKASQDAPMAAAAPAKHPRDTLAVNSVTYARHTKRGTGDPSMRVTYHVGILPAQEFIRFGTRRGQWWWTNHGGTLPAPETVDDAIERTTELRVPSHILVQKVGQYLNVLDYKYGPERQDHTTDKPVDMLCAAIGEPRH